ncbi:TetR/AcrR family transcriptional regulator [Kitasatospora sp. NPDC056138]|uniref:TetR/AcrR family transcriptional regulator n=1 Tax=Kitasatospora sp. NPDC056138 TaxID=3345724 RepID=UPI0035DD6D54
MSGRPAPAEQPAAPRRRRDAGRSRELLFDAAQKLFAERGFDRTTTREIGEHAGVDPALIARYFGGKTQLYIATMQAQLGDGAPADLLDEDRLRGLLEGMAQRGPGPVVRAAVMPHDDPAVQEAARAQLYGRLVTPLHDRLTRDGVPQPRLRAELAVAAVSGVLLARSAGALTELAAAEPEQLLDLVRRVVDATLPPEQDTPAS